MGGMSSPVQWFRHLEVMGGAVCIRIVEVKDFLWSDNENWKQFGS